jgi:hypothetical protein
MGTLLPSFSPICRDGLATPKVVQTLGDGAETVVVRGVWKPPAVVTEPMIFECRRWLDALRQCDATVQEGRIRVWLSRLLFGLSGNHSEDMIRAKLSSFAFALADKPAFCFDDGTLRWAQKHFKSFWPSAGELIEFMEKVEAEVRVKAERAWKVVDGGARSAGAPTTKRPWAKGGAEDHAQYLRDKQDRERRELIEIMRDRDAAAGKFAADAAPPARHPEETAKEYVHRLNAFTFAQIDEGAKARRKDEERYRRGRELLEEEKAAQRRPVKRAASPVSTEKQMQTAREATEEALKARAAMKAEDVREEQPAEAGPEP